MKICLIFLLILIFSVPALIAQDKDNLSAVSGTAIDSSSQLNVSPHSFDRIKTEDELNWHQMITRVPSDLSTFSKEAFASNQLRLLAVLAAGTGALLLVDQSGWDANKRLYNSSEPFHDLSDIGVNLGDEKYHFIMAGVFTVYGLVHHNSTSLKTASNIAEAVIASGIGVQILKRIFGRESPAVSSRTSGRWLFFPNLKEYQKHQPKFYAYPSGHITTLTATVTVIANNYPHEKWIKPVGYSMIGLCGIGLVSRGMHWYSDLPLGIFLGYTFGNLISPPEPDPEISGKENIMEGIKFSPMFSGQGPGLSLSYNF